MNNTDFNFFKKLRHINTFIFDVDGVLTNGMVQTSESGELLRAFNIKDGYALQHAVKSGYHLCIISGGESCAMQKRFKGLNIKEIHLGVHNKVKVFNDILQRNNIQSSQVLYMGDDIPDMEVMKLVGLACCPADAAEEIKSISQYISAQKGGNGCVRDILEKVLKVQGKWGSIPADAADSSK